MCWGKETRGEKSIAYKLQFSSKTIFVPLSEWRGKKFVKYLKQHEVDNLPNINFYLIVKRNASQ